MHVHDAATQPGRREHIGRLHHLTQHDAGRDEEDGTRLAHQDSLADGKSAGRIGDDRVTALG